MMHHDPPTSKTALSAKNVLNAGSDPNAVGSVLNFVNPSNFTGALPVLLAAA